MRTLHIALLRRISELGDITALETFLYQFYDSVSFLDESASERPDLRQRIVETLRDMQNKGWINCYYSRGDREYIPVAVDALLDYPRTLEITLPGKEQLRKISSLDEIPSERIFFMLLDNLPQIKSGNVNKKFQNRRESNLSADEREKQAREKILELIKARQGQQAFREALIRNYKHCLVTECRVIGLLEAAHIRPYSENRTHHLSNGLLLRTDIHTLFDLGLFSVDSTTMRVLIKPELRHTEYARYENQPLGFTEGTGHIPDTDALDEHRRKAGL